MFRDISIKGKLLLLSLITIIVVSLSITIDSLYSINKLSNENINRYKEESYAKKELELKNYVALLIKTVKSYKEKTEIDKIKLKLKDD